MEHRFLGASGFKVPVLGFGTGTFGGKGPLFSAWGNSGAQEARRLIDVCLDVGINFFDTADVYSDGASEQILGAALEGRRDRAIVSTKITLRTGDGANDVAPRGTTCCAPSIARCLASAPTTSTSCSCITSTR